MKASDADAKVAALRATQGLNTHDGSDPRRRDIIEREQADRDAVVAEQARTEAAIRFNIAQFGERLGKARSDLAAREGMAGPDWEAILIAGRKFHLAHERVRTVADDGLLDAIAEVSLTHEHCVKMAGQLEDTLRLISALEGTVALLEWEIASARGGGDALQRHKLETWASTGHNPDSKVLLLGADSFLRHAQVKVPPSGTPQHALIGERAAAAQANLRRSLGVRF